MLKQNTARRNLELRITYAGTRFKGWQIQPNGITVQGTINQALKKILGGEVVKTTGTSRTDTGVHAHDQRVTFTLENPIPMAGLKRALNRMLPEDIRVLEISPRPENYSARYHARAKHYAYYFYNGRDVSPFLSPYINLIRRSLNEGAMARAAKYFVGQRNFEALRAAADCRPGADTTIFKTRVIRSGRIIAFEVLGHRFLYHMVRNMAGSLLKVGSGEWSPEELGERLNAGRREGMGMTAPGKALHLIRIYDGEPPYTFSPRGARFLKYLQTLAT